MARDQNFLLGQGERITAPEVIKKGSSPKKPPYSFADAKKRATERLSKTLDALDKLPNDACPNDEAVAVVTLHPRFLSKSEVPSDMLEEVGLRTIGSRSRKITPDAWGIDRHANSALTAELFVAGTRAAFGRWLKTMPSWTSESPVAHRLTQIESISAVPADSKVKGLDSKSAPSTVLEVVIHNAHERRVIDAFVRFARSRGADPVIEHQKDIQGLTFLPVRLARATVTDAAAFAAELALFSFVRVARAMPTLRPFRPGILRGPSAFPVQLPVAAAIDDTTRAVIFDGGIPAAMQEQLKPWVRHVDPLDIGKPVPSFQEHGLAVTTAFLFGPLKPNVQADRPMCGVDHVRVLDENSGAGEHVDALYYYEVLERITNHLDSNHGAYKLANISLGPNMAVDDDEVTLWTASLDRRFAHENILVTVAAGNDGDRDPLSGLNRVQPPADGVNVLSVGASDRTDTKWARAVYSCVGPGRCPGIVKPDGVMFGGSPTEGFGVLDISGAGAHTNGTSFAAPYTLRSAAAITAQVGDRVRPLAVRALLVHRAQEHKHHDLDEVGWGHFDHDGLRLITCEDHEALVVYQGKLPVGPYLRARVPLPPGKLAGFVRVSATLAIAPEIDPQHPDAYTRAGVEVTFRPHTGKFATAKDGAKRKQPQTSSFFSEGNVYGGAESALREDGHKWEPVLRATRKYRASSLFEPCFDIKYHHRDEAAPNLTALPIPYALVISLHAPKVADLYNQVVRAYRNELSPFRPQLRPTLRTSGSR